MARNRWGVILSTCFVLVGCGGDGSSSMGGTTTPPDVSISILLNSSNLCEAAYDAGTVTINVGETIRWRNTDTTTHTVTINNVGCFDNNAICAGMPTPADEPCEFNSSFLQPFDTFSHTFNTAGTFHYKCDVSGHTMWGTVIVQQ